jgi:hypothetical protein
MGWLKVPGKRTSPNGNAMNDETSAQRPLSPAAQRALAEAGARRKAIDEKAAAAKGEKGGRGGLDPARYGDWEIKGLTADF